MLALLAICNDAYSQRKNIKKLLEAYGQNAQVYFLAANRPSYGVSSYTLGKGNLELASGISIGEDFYEVPVDITYGLSNQFDIFGGVNALTHTYDFEENTVSGLGDSRIGLRYKFHESEYFSHAFQTAVKIPTASSENDLGTGKVDIHFGLGHSYSSNNWGYDASIELNMLHRKDMPTTDPKVPKVIRDAIDSIKKVYDYTYEPEIGFSISPAYYPLSNMYVYTGLSYSRNTKLEYNTTSVYAGVGYAPNNIFSLSAGVSNGLEEGGSWLVSLGLTINLIRRMY